MAAVKEENVKMHYGKVAFKKNKAYDVLSMCTCYSVRDGTGVLAEEGLIEALSIAFPKQPGDFLLEHHADRFS